MRKSVLISKLVTTLLTSTAMVLTELSAYSQSTIVDYAQNIGSDFLADYAPVSNLPQNNPFGPHAEWELIGRNDIAAGGIGRNPPASSVIDLVATTSIPASGQNGWWVDQTQTTSPNNPSYGYFQSGWPSPSGDSLPPRSGGIAGHGFHEAVWTAPVSVDSGGIEVSGWIEQLFEAGRQIQLRLFLNNETESRLLVNTVAPPDNSAVTTTVIEFGPIVIPIEDPGFDALYFFIDGAGPSGNTINTFSGWNVELTEVAVNQPTLGVGDYNGDGEVNDIDYLVWKASFGSSVNLAADGNNDGRVDAADYTVWNDQVGTPLMGSRMQDGAGSPHLVPEPRSAIHLVILVMTLAAVTQAVRTLRTQP